MMESLCALTAPTEAGQRPASRPTLLIVDDEEGPRQSLSLVFKDEYNVLAAENGPRALELIQQNPVNAAVLDIRMPGMSGIDLLGRLRQHDPDLGVVMLTGYATVDTAQEALRLGATDYIYKPFDLHTMRGAVSKAVTRQAIARQVRANNQLLGQMRTQICDSQIKEELARKRGDIYACVLHDINNPLTIICNVIELMTLSLSSTSSLAGESLESVRKQLEQLEAQISNCIQVSQRYLGFLRQRSPGEARVQVNQVLSDLSLLLKPHPSLGHSQLVIRSLPSDAWVALNGTDLIQILLNLTINALQCSAEAHQVEVSGALLTEPPGPALLPKGPGTHLLNWARFANTPPLVLLTVKDNGPGIPADTLARIFEPYYSTKPVGKGTGLGLAIVQFLVEQANAALHLESHPAQGTTFSLFLPAQVPTKP